MPMATVAMAPNSVKATNSSASMSSVPMTVGISFQSASLPPMMLPMVMPPPNSSSTQVTADVRQAGSRRSDRA